MRPRASLACALLLLPAALHAQRAPRLDLDERVRVLAPAVSSDLLVGSVLDVYADTLVLRPQGTELALRIPFDAMQRLEVAGGRRRDQHARVGAIVGAAAGVVVAVIGLDDDCPECGALDRTIMAVPLGLIGAGLGGVLGLISAGEEWDPVALPQRSRPTGDAGGAEP